MPAIDQQELDPLTCERLSRRFRHTRVVMDGEVMRRELERLLFEGTGVRVDACARPKAELSDATCWLQYPLHVRTSTNQSGDVLVLGTMFTGSGLAARFERAALAPLAARWHPSSDPSPRPTGTVDSLDLAVSVFPINNTLPTLVDATNPDCVSAVFRARMSDWHGGAITGIDLVHLRRTRGCVLRYRLQAPRQRVVYGKVGYGAPSKIIHDAVDVLAGQDGAIRFPHEVFHSNELDLSVVDEVPGSRPDLRSETAVEEAVDAAARIAASLHTSGVTVPRMHTFDDEIARARSALEEVRRYAPRLAAWLTTIVDAVEITATRWPATAMVLAHGDFTPSQLLLDGPTVGIVDFDKLCQAEPAFDLGRFVAYLRFALKKHGNRRGDAMVSRFLNAYEAFGGPAASSARVDLYEATSLIRMAARSWLQLKPARLSVVASVLEKRAEPMQVRGATRPL